VPPAIENWKRNVRVADGRARLLAVPKGALEQGFSPGSPRLKADFDSSHFAGLKPGSSTAAYGFFFAGFNKAGSQQINDAIPRAAAPGRSLP